MTAAEREQYDGVPLALACFCQNCEWIGAQQNQCPKCAGESLLELAALINREKKTDADPPPVHPFEIRISIGANSWDFAERTLSEIANDAENEGSDMGNCFSGSYDGCHSITIAKRDVTGEQYRAELEQWSERQRRTKKEKATDAVL